MTRGVVAAALTAAALLAAACSHGSPQGATTRLTVPATTTPPVSEPSVAPPTTLVDAPTITAPAPQPSAGSDVTPIRFTPNWFVDPMSNGISAFSVLVPDGWQATGSVQWLPFWSRLAFVQTRVADPVSGVTIDWLPIQDFMWFTPPAGFDVPIGGNYQGKAYVAPITDPAEFVRQFWVPNDLAELLNAQLVSIVEIPIIAEEFAARFGGPAQAAAYRLRYSYMLDGQAWERDVQFALLFSTLNGITSWYVNFAHTVSGPQGQLDAHAGVVSTVVASRLSTTEWEANFRLVQQLFVQGIQQQMADTVAFGELLEQYHAESRALQQQVTDERWASQDRQAVIAREGLGGVTTYIDPTTNSPVQLPATWDIYWVNEHGEYLAVGDPNFDPNTLDDGTWEILVEAP